MRCELPAAVKAAAKRKMRVGVLFKEIIEAEIKSGEFKVVKLPVKYFDGQSFIVYRKDRPLSKTAQDFLDLLHRRRQKPTGRQTKAKLPH